MAKIALMELENLSLAARTGGETDSLMEQLVRILDGIRMAWREQEKRREEEERERESLFRSKKKEKKEEEEIEEEFRDMFPDHGSGDFLDFREEGLEQLESWRREGNRGGDVVERREDRARDSLERSAKLLFRGSRIGARFPSSIGPKRGETYNFYKNPNVDEVERCRPLFDRLSARIDELASEWPENPLLNSIRTIIDRVHGFPIESPLSRYLTGVELLLAKMKQWEENARHDVSLAEFIESFGGAVLRWRRLEFSRWNDTLELVEDESRADFLEMVVLPVRPDGRVYDEQ
ncbi:midasin [Apis mellifera carnica]|nr:midasin [Apis mellifera carnica]